MKTAVIYARYSSDNQTEQSIEGQLRVCQEYAQRNDILIVNTYIDRAMTGTNDNRPDFQQMLRDSSKKEWNYVLVYKLDRFSRNKYEATIHKHTLHQNGIKVLSAMENIPDTPEGIILEALLEGMNQYYSVELAQKVRRGMLESRLKGNFTGGIVPYGYRVENKKILIDETKAPVVQYMFKQYSLGIPASEISKNLTIQGAVYKGKPFKKTTIYRILKNERYTGIYKLGDKVFTNLFPQIIDAETFNKVQVKNKENQYGSYSVKTVYLFRNKLKCGYCGMPISADSARTRNKTKLNYYKCLGIKNYRNGCKKETIRQEVLESFLLNAIITELEKPKFQDKMVETLQNIQKNSSSVNTRLNMLLKTQKQTESMLENIMKAVEQGIFNKTTSTRMKELEEQLETLEKQIVIEKSKSTTKISEEDIRKFYRVALEQKPLELINYLIKEIKLYNDKVEIKFNSPIKSSDNNQGFFILSKTKELCEYKGKHTLPQITDMHISFYI